MKKFYSNSIKKWNNNKLFYVASSIIATSILFKYTNSQEDKNEEKIENETENVQDKNRFHYKYVIVGGGTAALSGLMGIRESDKESPILLISQEDQFYNRTQLSKALWRSPEELRSEYRYKTQKGKITSIIYPKLLSSTATIWNNTVDHVDLTSKVILVGEKVVHFDKVLIATGATPKRLYGVEAAAQNQVSSFKTLQDFDKIKRLVEEASPDNPKTIVVVGGNFLGTELTSELSLFREKGVNVVQVFRESSPLSSFLPEYLSEHLLGVGISRGITYHTGKSIERVEKQGKFVNAILNDGKSISCDHIITAIGTVPNSQIIIGNAIEVDNDQAIVVNVELQARSNVWAAGDVASFFSLSGRGRFRHHNDAIESGFVAGRNMTGQSEPLLFHHLYSSEIFGVQFDVVGNISSTNNSYGIWSKSEEESKLDNREFPPNVEAGENTTESEKHALQLSLLPKEDLSYDPLQRSFQNPGIVYYTARNDTVVGVLLWNLTTKKKKTVTDKAMEVLLEQTKLHDVLEASGLIPLVNPQDKYEED